MSQQISFIFLIKLDYREQRVFECVLFIYFLTFLSVMEICTGILRKLHTSHRKQVETYLTTELCDFHKNKIMKRKGLIKTGDRE